MLDLKVCVRMCALVVAALVLLAAVPAPAAAQNKVNLVFSAGPTGGSWTPMAAATAEVIKRKFPEIDVQVEPGAALVNMEKMRNDKTDLGWSMTTVLSDARAGAPLRRLTGHLKKVQAIAFSADGRLLFACGSYGMTNVWEVATGRHLVTLFAFTENRNGTSAASP